MGETRIFNKGMESPWPQARHKSEDNRVKFEKKPCIVLIACRGDVGAKK